MGKQKHLSLRLTAAELLAVRQASVLSRRTSIQDYIRRLVLGDAHRVLKAHNLPIPQEGDVIEDEDYEDEE